MLRDRKHTQLAPVFLRYFMVRRIVPDLLARNHVPGADYSGLVNAPVRIMVGDADDYDGGGEACEQMLRELGAQMPPTCRCVSFRAPPISSAASHPL